jgi:hypothetical protein
MASVTIPKWARAVRIKQINEVCSHAVAVITSSLVPPTLHLLVGLLVDRQFFDFGREVPASLRLLMLSYRPGFSLPCYFGNPQRLCRPCHAHQPTAGCGQQNDL